LEQKLKFIEDLLKTIEIQINIVSNSKYFDANSKYWMNFTAEELIQRLNTEKFTLTQLKSISSGLLIYWKESISMDTELFWCELTKHNIRFERKDELNFALKKGRFRRVDIGMLARRDWGIMKNQDSIKCRFSEIEIKKIEVIISNDEKNRFEILTKCLEKSKIPQNKYLKFGECWAYFSNCNLWEQYFNKEEKDKLLDIWRSFNAN
jgi:hypothetical protein